MIYADNASTTRLSSRVLETMFGVLSEAYGNPSSVYDFGGRSRRIIESARSRVASVLCGFPREIYFTSGGTESDNWAIKGAAAACKKDGKNHIISSQFEHLAVLNSLEFLRRNQFDVTLINVNSNGIIDPNELINAIRPNTGLVSIMFANNEIGTIQPIAELGEICRKFGLIFHTDAVQAVDEIEIDLRNLPVDLLSISGHKIRASKGVGVLYIRDGIEIDSFMDGGKQERGQRAGTENTAAIAGLGEAIIEAKENRTKKNYVKELRERFIDGVLQIQGSRIHGDRIQRLSNNANIALDNIEGESVVLMLDRYGICCSTGAACSSGAIGVSHVIKSLGYPNNKANEAVRFTFSEENTIDEIDFIIEKLKQIRSTQNPK